MLIMNTRNSLSLDLQQGQIHYNPCRHLSRYDTKNARVVSRVNMFKGSGYTTQSEELVNFHANDPPPL